MITGIYLAAGQSKRMGQPKLSLPVGEQNLGSMALETAIRSLLDVIVLVTPEEEPPEWIPSRFFSPPYRDRWVHQPCKESIQGQSASLQCGLKVAQQLQSEAVMIILADQPWITVKMLNQLICLYHMRKENYIASCYQGVPRPPVLFDSDMFPDLFQLQGDEGARRILRKDSDRGLLVEYKHEKSFLDIDTPSQYQRLCELY